MAEIAAAAYEAASTVAQGAIAAAKGLSMPTTPLRATFRPLRGPPHLPRSSHTLTVVRNRAYIFGGEIKPREPVDNAVHVITLPSAELQEADYVSVPARPATADGAVPEPRVGHAAAAVGQHIYVSGGRGGSSMQAFEEKGRVWVFDTTLQNWSYLDPNDHSPHPPARSYHAMTSSEHPLPPSKPTIDTLDPSDPSPDPDTAHNLTDAQKAIPEPAVPHSHGTLFVHAGCLADGSRTSDLWAFDISSRSWSEMPSAPGPSRGGTALRLVKDRLYRYGGFNGETELGGAIDHLDLVSSTFDDKAGKGEMPLHPNKHGWQSTSFAASADHNMSDRSVAGMAPMSTGQGRHYLLILGGERDPSTAGHAGAGKFLDDVWSFQLKPEGGTAAAVKDATRQFIMKKDTGEAEVHEVRYYDAEGTMIQEGQRRSWGPRGWFACDVAQDVGGEAGGTIILWGGVNESNERLGDGWILQID